MNTKDIQSFWRDSRLPFIEAREVLDGRHFCFDKHHHDEFSIGTICSGTNHYWNQHHSPQTIGQGSTVIVNPHDTHACSSLENQPWSYRMFYINRQWLHQFQHSIGLKTHIDLHLFKENFSQDPILFSQLNQLHHQLVSPNHLLQKQIYLIEFMELMHQRLDFKPILDRPCHLATQKATQYIHDCIDQEINLDTLCQIGQISPTHLNRSFKQHYGLTPHAYMINHRINQAKHLLQGKDKLVDIAQKVGFADQAHFQRVFKKYVLATPGQYRQSM